MISYAPLFKTMQEKRISSYALFQEGFAKSTYHSIRQGNSISTNMLEDHYGVSWKLIFGVGWRDLTSITLGDPNRYGYTITTI